MISVGQRRYAPARSRRILGAARALGWAVGAGLASLLVAFLVANGLWWVAVAALLAIPMFVVVHRYPLAMVAVWLFVMPLIVVSTSPALRQLYWVIHRGLPLATLLVLVIAAGCGINGRRLAKLGWAEVLMASYVLASLVSILYLSSTPLATTYVLYDRVIVPMMLYLIVRLVEPDDRDLDRLAWVVLFVFAFQVVVGVLTWAAPGVLPAPWLQPPGRTNGSFGDPDVFLLTVLFCGLLMIHRGLTSDRWTTSKVPAAIVFSVMALMVFITFSRGDWVAGTVAMTGALYVFRQYLGSLLLIAIPVGLLLLVSGLLSGQLQYAQQRLHSTETAIGRLPVDVAALRMLEVKPIAGWGYGNFDIYSPPFQQRVGNFIVPDKDHSSHNLFLSILAEQGLLGFALFLSPMAYWLLKTRASVANMPVTDRKLLASMWLVVAAVLITNNTSVMKVPYGLGLWWIALGLIGSLVHRYRPVHRPGLGGPAIGSGSAVPTVQRVAA